MNKQGETKYPKICRRKPQQRTKPKALRHAGGVGGAFRNRLQLAGVIEARARRRVPE